MLVVVVGGVGRGSGRSIESTTTNVGEGRGVGRGSGRSIESTTTNVGGGSRGVGRGRGRSIESTTTNVGGRRGWVEGEGEVDQFEAPVQMLMVGGEVGRGRGRSS